MTKAELVEVVAAQSRLTKKSAAEIIDIVFSNIGKAVKRDARFSYPGFGTWSVRSRIFSVWLASASSDLLKRHSSTAVAFSEKRAKLTPSPSHVAPSGYGCPGQTRIYRCSRRYSAAE